MIIDWFKVSEILLDALLTGIISASIILTAYFLGKRQSEKEQKVREKKELNTRRIDVLLELSNLFLQFFLVITRGEKRYYIDEGAESIAGRIKMEAEKVLPLFPTAHESEINNDLNRLITLMDNLKPIFEWYGTGYISAKITKVNEETGKEELFDNPLHIKLNDIYQNVKSINLILQTRIEELVKEFG